MIDTLYVRSAQPSSRLGWGFMPADAVSNTWLETDDCIFHAPTRLLAALQTAQCPMLHRLQLRHLVFESPTETRARHWRSAWSIDCTFVLAELQRHCALLAAILSKLRPSESILDYLYSGDPGLQAKTHAIMQARLKGLESDPPIYLDAADCLLENERVSTLEAARVIVLATSEDALIDTTCSMLEHFESFMLALESGRVLTANGKESVLTENGRKAAMRFCQNEMHGLEQWLAWRVYAAAREQGHHDGMNNS